MKKYSMDLRQRVLEAAQAKQESQRVIAKRFKVSERWIRWLLVQYREQGHVRLPKPRCGRKPAFDDSARAKLKQKVEEQPDITLDQLRQWAEDELGIVCSLMAVDRALKKEKLTYKKNSKSKRTRAFRCQTKAQAMANAKGYH